MNKVRAAVTFLFVALVALAAVTVAVPSQPAVLPGVPTVSTAVTTEPQEDEPGFDCHIHGNRICGPTDLAA